MSTTSQSHSQDKLRPTMQRGDEPSLEPARDLLDYAKEYARERPEVMALWCFGIGFILGWRLKPW